jgi:murein L,D-transpeptidase YcbB/YkuD
VHDDMSNAQAQAKVHVFQTDSVQLNKFFQDNFAGLNYTEDIKKFYAKRNNEFAWINSEGINEYAMNFLNLLNQENDKLYGNNIPYKDELYHLIDRYKQGEVKHIIIDSNLLKLEFLLTANFFDYAKRNWAGINEEQLKKVGWFIDKRKLNYEEWLDSILKNKPSSFSTFQPVFRQYALLKKWLVSYSTIEQNGGWPLLNYRKTLQEGDTSAIIPFLKNQLFLMKDLASNDSGNVFNAKVTEAVKCFQRRYGLPETGVIEQKTGTALKIPVQALIQKMLINMERFKWVPVEQKGDYLAVNIPDFKLLVYNNGKVQWSCKVIVGKTKTANNTVVFNNNLEYVVFSPYWNIPQNILIKETLPEQKKNSNYLASHDMEVVNAQGVNIDIASIEWQQYSNAFPYIIRQKPGKNNALGLVKFLFPNTYDIYMHDTPEKSLFGETKRAFSHGCIRVEEPFKLAQYLLRNDPDFSDEKIKALMNGGKQTFVKLKASVPVFITYFTAWVDADGKLNFRDDVYRHDAAMKQLLFND